MDDDENYKDEEEVTRPETFTDYKPSGQYGFCEELAKVEELIDGFLSIEIGFDGQQLDDFHQVLDAINQEIENIPDGRLQNLVNIKDFFHKCFQCIIIYLNEKHPIVCEFLYTIQCFISKYPQFSLYFEPHEQQMPKKMKKKTFINDDEQPFEVKEDQESGIFALKLVLEETENTDEFPFLVRFDLLSKIVADACKCSAFSIRFGEIFFEPFNEIISVECSNNNFETISFYVNVFNYFIELYNQKDSITNIQIETILDTINLFLERITNGDQLDILNLIYTFLITILHDEKMLFALYSHNTYQVLFSRSFDEVYTPLLIDFLNTSLYIDDSDCEKIHEILVNEISSKINIGDFIAIAKENQENAKLIEDIISLIFNKIVTDDSIEDAPLPDILEFCEYVLKESTLDNKTAATELYIEILKYLPASDFPSFFKQELFTIILEGIAPINQSNAKRILDFIIDYHEPLLQQIEVDQLKQFLDEIEDLGFNLDKEISFIRENLPD